MTTISNAQSVFNTAPVIYSGDIKVSLNFGLSTRHNERESAIVDYVSAKCGSGKTFVYSGHINDTITARFIVAAKTEGLAKKISEGINGAELITTNGLNLRTTCDKRSVTAAFSMAVKSYAHRVIVSTAKGLELLARNIYHDAELMNAMSDYQVLIDEAPDSRKTVAPLVLTVAERSMIPWLQYTTTLPDGQMISANNGKLREALKSSAFRGPDYLVALINGDPVRVKELDDNRLELRTNPRSDLYLVSRYCAGGKITVFGADIELSPWMKRGLRNGHIGLSAPSTTYQIDPKRNDHRNTDRVRVFNMLNIPKGSKRVIRSRIQTIADGVLSGIRAAGHQAFIWTSNKDDAEGLIQSEFQRIFELAMPPVTLADGTKQGAWFVSPMSHGLNQYQEFTCAVFLCAVNLSPTVKAELDDDADVSETEDDGHLMACYQFVSRGVIRQRDEAKDNIKFDCFVVDQAQQDYLVDRFFTEGHRDKSLSVEVEHVDRAKAQADRGTRKTNKTLELLQSAYELLKLTEIKVTQGDCKFFCVTGG